MKTRIIALLLLASVCFGQSLVQNQTAVMNAWPQVPWYFLEYGETANLANIPIENFAAGDSAYSKVYRTMPWQTLELNISGAGSVNMYAELWESMKEDTSTFQFVKTLLWHRQREDSVSTATAVINTTGYWWCNFGEGDIFNGSYFSLVKLFTKIGHDSTGCDITGIFKGEVLTR